MEGKRHSDEQIIGILKEHEDIDVIKILKIGAPETIRTSDPSLHTTIAFVTNFCCLWPGLSLHLKLKFLGVTRLVSAPSPFE